MRGRGRLHAWRHARGTVILGAAAATSASDCARRGRCLRCPHCLCTLVEASACRCAPASHSLPPAASIRHPTLAALRRSQAPCPPAAAFQCCRADVSTIDFLPCAVMRAAARSTGARSGWLRPRSAGSARARLLTRSPRWQCGGGEQHYRSLRARARVTSWCCRAQVWSSCVVRGSGSRWRSRCGCMVQLAQAHGHAAMDGGVSAPALPMR